MRRNASACVDMRRHACRKETETKRKNRREAEKKWAGQSLQRCAPACIYVAAASPRLHRADHPPPEVRLDKRRKREAQKTRQRTAQARVEISLTFVLGDYNVEIGDDPRHSVRSEASYDLRLPFANRRGTSETDSTDSSKQLGTRSH